MLLFLSSLLLVFPNIERVLSLRVTPPVGSQRYIAVFKDKPAMARMRAACAPASSNTGVDPRCLLPGFCRRFFNATLLGGLTIDLSPPQLQRFIACHGHYISYIEKDGRVFKAEGASEQRHPGPSTPIAIKSLVVWESESDAPPGPSTPTSSGSWAPRRRLRHSRRLTGTPGEGPVPALTDDDRTRMQLLDRVTESSAESNASLSFQIYPTPVAPGIEDFTKGSSDGSLPVLNGEPLQVPTALERTPNVVGLRAQNLHPALWFLDRIDQRIPPFDRTFYYGPEGSTSGLAPGVGMGRGVTVYAVDSGVRITHQEFGDWAGGPSRASYGYNFVEDEPQADDCDGHGTHVSSTAVGRTVGVAKQAKVVAVRVLDCTGAGSVSDTIAGLDWVANNVQRPAVVTLSLGIAVGVWSRALEASVRSLVVDHGVTVVVAAGNSATDSCFVAPANVQEAITVSASNFDNKFASTVGTPDTLDTIYTYANTGLCTSLFAPGVDIYGACGGASRCGNVSDYAYAWASGTSMSVPFVAGTAALYQSANPTATPQNVKAAIVGRATKNRLTGPSSLLRSGTPNLLLFTRGLGNPMPPQVTASDGPTANGNVESDSNVGEPGMGPDLAVEPQVVGNE